MWRAAGLALVVVLLAGCSQSQQSIAQSNVTAADVTACHALGQTAYKTKSPTQAQTDQTFADLDKASNSALRSGAKAAEVAVRAGDTANFRSDVQAIAQTCHDLGLLDANGNPT